MYSINTNLAADNAARSLSTTNEQMNVAMQQLSTGEQAVNAATSASALSITFSTQSEGLDQAMKNAQTGINYLNVMSSSVKETTLLLQKMKELTTQAQNAGYSASDREQMNDEFDQLKTEINRNANSAKFNGESLINTDGPGTAKLTSSETIAATGFDGSTTAGSFDINVDGSTQTITLNTNITSRQGVIDAINSQIAASSTIAGKVTASVDSSGKLVLTSASKGTSATVSITSATNATGLAANTTAVNGTAGKSETFHVGYNTDSQNNIAVNAHNLTTAGLGVDNINIKTVADAATADDALSAALTSVSSANSEFRAIAGRLGYTMDNMSSIKQNTDSALSTVRDTDYAHTTTELSKQKVLQQAASAMLTQANHAPQQALQLLKG